MKRRLTSGTESYAHPEVYFDKKKQALYEKVISRAGPMLRKNEKVENVFDSNLRAIKLFRRLTLLSIIPLLIYYSIELLFITVSPGGVWFTLPMLIIPSVLSIFQLLTTALFNYTLFGFDPKKLAFLATRERIMIFHLKGGYISSIWIRNITSIVVVSSASRDGESANIIFPLPFAVNESPDLGHHRFMGLYVGKMRKITGKKFGNQFWKNNIAFVDGENMRNIIAFIQSHSPTPVHVFNYRAGKKSMLQEESTLAPLW